MTTQIESVPSSQLVFSSFTESFLEKSWLWLNDPETKAMTQTPDFTREDQKRWFGGLRQRSDYKIWGISRNGDPIGALGLKHITAQDAEYWGYIGERTMLGRGVGRSMMRFILEQANGLRLVELYLKVRSDNTFVLRFEISILIDDQTTRER